MRWTMLISTLLTSLLVSSIQATQYIFKEYPITEPKNSYCPGRYPPPPSQRTCTTIEFPVHCNMTRFGTSDATVVDLAACVEGFKTLYRNITTDESTWDCLSTGNKVTVVDGPKCVDDSGQGEQVAGLDVGVLGSGGTKSTTDDVDDSAGQKDDDNVSSQKSDHDDDVGMHTQDDGEEQTQSGPDDESASALNSSAQSNDDDAGTSEQIQSAEENDDDFATALNESLSALPPKARPYGTKHAPHRPRHNPHDPHNHHNGVENLTPAQIDDLFSTLDPDTQCNLQVTLSLTSADQHCQVQNFFMYWVNTTQWNITSTPEQPKGKFDRVWILDQCLA